MRPPVVLFVAPSAYLLSGLATWLDYIDPGLSAKGWEVVIGLVEGSAFHRPEAYLQVHPHRNWIAIPCPTGTEEGRRRALSKAIHEIAPDVVVAVNTPDVFAAIGQLRAAGITAPKAVMTAHGIEPWLYDEMHHLRPWIDGVICTNRLSFRLAECIGTIELERIGYAPCGVADGGGGLPQRRDHLRLAYVGLLEQWHKRVHDLPVILDLLEHHGIPFQLVIAGIGPEEDVMRQSLAPRCLTGQVTFLGRLNPAQVKKDVYPHVDALIMPSFSETGPIVVWEALAFGVPVVASRYMGSGCESALVNEENALLFPIGDTQEAARLLARLWREPELAQRMSTNGYRLMNQRYSLESSVTAWDRALHNVRALPQLPATPIFPSRRAPGRLDRCLGASIGETIRTWSGCKCVANDPGGEWPHSYSSMPLNDQDFWLKAERIERDSNNKR
jgi:glycosyltransferase involved in cell wall biosynthesis